MHDEARWFLNFIILYQAENPMARDYNFRPTSACNCNISCITIDKLRSYKGSDQVIIFLKGLNDQYAVVRSQIMLMVLIPNICKVYSLLVQQEKQIILPLDELKLIAFPNNQSQGRGKSMFRGKITRGGWSFNGRARGARIYTNCGMINHTISTCFKKHGYPHHWKPR